MAERGGLEISFGGGFVTHRDVATGRVQSIAWGGGPGPRNLVLRLFSHYGCGRIRRGRTLGSAPQEC
jgi:hypothetical protein